jgi:hypothetical protein
MTAKSSVFSDGMSLPILSLVGHRPPGLGPAARTCPDISQHGKPQSARRRANPFNDQAQGCTNGPSQTFEPETDLATEE